MKRLFYILIFFVATLLITSCDKWDCNGDLDGMWQLTEWRDKENNLIATKDDMIFYSFQLQMASDGHDKEQPMSILSIVGVPEDGIFHIDVLTGGTMKLKTNTQETLVFRKY